ncbi:unnamed protein product [Rotaria magnacalcarata]
MFHDVVSRAEESRISYNLQTEEFRNLNADLQIYVGDLKTIDDDNRQLQESIEQIRTNYILSLENQLKRLPQDFHEHSRILTDGHIQRYASKSRARRFFNESEEFKRRIVFVSSNEKWQTERLNVLQKIERSVHNELIKLNRQLQSCLKYVEKEKQAHQKSMDIVDDLQVQLEQKHVERSKTEFEIQTLKEELQLMHQAKEFLDEEHETIIAAETEANEYLLSSLNESIVNIREDFNQLNTAQITQIENEYKQTLQDVEESLTSNQTTNDTTTSNQQLQDEYHVVAQELTTLKNDNSTLSERVLTMEANLSFLREERIQQLQSKDHDIERSTFELHSLKEKLNQLAEYDRNLKFELALYRGVLESEHRRKQYQKQASTNITNVRRPTTLLQSNINVLTNRTTSINEGKFNDQQEEKILTTNDKIQVIGECNQEHDRDRTSVNISPQCEVKPSISISSVILTGDQLISPFETQQSSLWAFSKSSEVKESSTSSSPVVRADQSLLSSFQQLSATSSELNSLPIGGDISPTNTNQALFEVHQIPSAFTHEFQTVPTVPTVQDDPITSESVLKRLPSPVTIIAADTQQLPLITSEEHLILSRVSSEPSFDIQKSRVSSGILIATEHIQPESTFWEPSSPSLTTEIPLIPADNQILSSLTTEIPLISADNQILSSLTTPTTAEYQESTFEDYELSLSTSSEASTVPFDTARSPLCSSMPMTIDYEQAASDLHQPLPITTSSETAVISTDMETLHSSPTMTTTIDIQEETEPVSDDDYQEIKSEKIIYNVDSESNASLGETDNNVELEESTLYVIHEREIDDNEPDPSIPSRELPSKKDYELSIDTTLNDSELLSASIQQEETKRSPSSSFIIIVSDDDKSSELKQDETLEQIQREEEISSSLIGPVSESNTVCRIVTTIITSDNVDNNTNENNPLPLPDTSEPLPIYVSSTGVEVDKLTSRNVETIYDDEDDPSLAAIMEDLRYVFHELANDEHLVEINNDLSAKLLDRLEFRDYFIQSLFDNIIRKYIVESAVQTNRCDSLDWIAFRDILFPIITGRYTERHIRKLFDLFDTSKDGRLSVQEITELLQILQVNHTIGLTQNIMDEYDTDHDGKLSVDELIEAIKKIKNINENVLPEEAEHKQWFNQNPTENPTISFEVPTINFPNKTNDKFTKEISLLAIIFKTVGADSDNKLLNSNRENLSTELKNEFINTNINMSTGDLQLFIDLFLKNRDSLINWIEFRDSFLPIITSGHYSKYTIERWFDVFDSNHNGLITREETIQLLRLLQIHNSEEIISKLNDIRGARTNDITPWTLDDLIFALDNLCETSAYLLTNNEQIASFDIDWLANHIF